MAVTRRVRKVHLVEKDPEDLQQEVELEKEEQRRLLASLHLAPAEAYRYPETILIEETDEEEEDDDEGTDDVFALDYDSMPLSELMALLTRITPSHVLQLRQKCELQHVTVKDSSQQIEYFLDALPSSSMGAENTLHESAGHSGAAGEEPHLGYTFNEMLTRIFTELDRNNESSARAGRNKIPTPKLESVGKKKTCITNFARICEAINRPVEYVKEYVEKELSCKGSLDSKNALTLKFQMQKSTDLDNLLQRYLDLYVKCNSCHRIDTELVRNGRLSELHCNFCTASRTVTATTTSTYNAVVEKRARTRAANLTL